MSVFRDRQGCPLRPPSGASRPKLVDQVKGSFPGLVVRNLPVRFPAHNARGRRDFPPVEAAIRAESDDRSTSDFGSLGQEQRVLHVDTKIPDGVLNLGVTE